MGGSNGYMVAISVRTAAVEPELGQLEAAEEILLERSSQGVAVANAGGAVKYEGIHSLFGG